MESPVKLFASRIVVTSQLGRLPARHRLSDGGGVRLNTYTDSVEPARALGPCPWDRNRLARAAIKRRGPVQKHVQFTHPRSIQFADGGRFSFLAERATPVFCGRAVGADAPKYLFVPELCRWRGKRAGGEAASLSSRPRRSKAPR